MADGVSAIKTRRLVSPSTKQNPPNPSKFYSHFLFRALLAIVFFVIVPVFPSIAPEFLNQSFFTESWELLHIVFVGIAVSYGLFSRRYDDSGGESPAKSDSTQSFVSRLLQASSVFDEDADSPTGSFDDGGNKVQTWSSQYFRNEPVVVVAKKEGSGSGKKIDSVSGLGDDKPLLLPVRSLKSRLPDENGVGDSRVSGRTFSRSSSYGSSSAPKKNSHWEKKVRNGSLKYRTSDVHGSSGYGNGDFEFSGSLSPSSSNTSSKGDSTRMSTETINGGSGGHMDGEYVVPAEEDSVVLPSPIPWRSRSGKMEIKEENVDDLPPMEGMEPNGSFICKPSRSSRLSSTSSPSKVLPSPASLLESQAKRGEDLVRRKTVYRSSPPPPPPPPPMPLYKSSLVNSSSCMATDHDVSRKELKRSVWSEPNDYELSAGEKDSLVARADSARVLQANERSKVDFSSAGKSVRTIRAGHGVAPARSWQEAAGEQTATQKSDKVAHERNSLFSDYKNETGDFFGEVLAVSDDNEYDSEHVADGCRGEVEKPENGKEEGAASSSGADDEGPDVDKKADEFIAKFREQIRLQRIESIKRSTEQFSKTSMR